MDKIASPRELTSEIQRVLAYVQGSQPPERRVLASELRSLADRVAVRGNKDFVEHIGEVHSSVGALVSHWQDERNDRMDAEHRDALKKPFAEVKDALDDAMAALLKAHQIAKSKIGVRR